jgi:hypothetical protein
MRTSPLILIAVLLLPLAASGCASAVAAGTAVALDEKDLVSMTDQMAREIAASPRVQRELAEAGGMAIVVFPAQNRLRGEVVPRGAAELFTARVRGRLDEVAPQTFTWVMNRDSFYRLREDELAGNVSLGPAPGMIEPTHALHATLSSLAEETRRGRSAYYLCTFELTDLSLRNVLWTGRYEVQKRAVKGFLD